MLFFIAVPVYLFPLPSEKADSLNKLLHKCENDDDRLRLWLDLAELYQKEYPDTSMKYLGLAEKQLKSTHSLYYLGRSFAIRGNVAWNLNDFEKAVRLFKMAVFCFEKIGEKKEQMALLNQVGANYSLSGNTSTALKYYLRCKEIAEELHATDMLARLNNNIGRIYISSEDYSKGIEYYKKALRVFEKGSDTFKTATVNMNLGTAYQHTSDLSVSRNYLEKAISLFTAIKRPYYVGNCLMIYSFTLYNEKKYPEALDYLRRALGYAELPPATHPDRMSSKILLSDVNTYSGITSFQLGEYDNARKFLLRGYHLADSLDLLESCVLCTSYLSETYEKRGRVDSAFRYYKVFKELSDSLTKIRSINIVKLAEVQMEYDKEVNDKKMQLVYAKGLQKRNLIIFIAAGAILISLVIILILRLRIEKHKEKRIEIERRKAALEKLAADQKLEAQNKELAAKVIHSTRINELVLGVAEKLKKMEVEEGSPNSKIRNELINELINSTNKNDSWKEFELRFQNVHNEFYKKLRDRFPDLTTNEVRLSALLRLNMTTKEISALTHQSERAIVLSRHRLRQKLGLQTADNLVVFLSQF
jgi:tetratricopeptide (TPR) repeat protein